MRRLSDILFYLTVIICMVSFSCSCTLRELTYDYHPAEENVSCEVHLKFDVESMFDWDMMEDHIFPDSTRSYEPSGTMRYILRLCPVLPEGRVAGTYVQEHIRYGEISDIYGETFTLDIPSGEYDLMVWADMMIPGSDREFFYDPADFGEITLARHCANTDYRDAFRGVHRVNVLADMYDDNRTVIIVNMARPLAKYEFVTTDLDKFITKALSHSETKSLEDYKVVFYYVGFMPSAYSILTDKPVDSSTGVVFESSVSRVSDTEAMLGFDYVFVREEDSAVTVQIGIYDTDGTQMSLTEPVEVPLMRNRHTVIKGAFMTQEASSGVNVNPDYDGEHNLIIP